MVIDEYNTEFTSKKVKELPQIIEVKNDFTLIADLKKLLIGYGKYMYENLHFSAGKQSFYEELENFTINGFQKPWETFIIAKIKESIVGCVGIKKFTDDSCEMKRMFILPAFRGKGIGQSLCKFVIEWSLNSNYQRLLLDTNIEMEEAIGLYKKLGFKEIAPYCLNDNKNPIFMEYVLK